MIFVFGTPPLIKPNSTKLSPFPTILTLFFIPNSNQSFKTIGIASFQKAYTDPSVVLNFILIPAPPPPSAANLPTTVFMKDPS